MNGVSECYPVAIRADKQSATCLAEPEAVPSASMAAAIPIIRPKMPELDSVRGIAILMVLLYHGFYWSNGLEGFSGLLRTFVDITRLGWLGVNLFFVLSGFLITGILLDSKADGDYFRRFYVRRALRILPALYALLLMLILIGYPGRLYLTLSFLYLSNLTPLWGIGMSYPMLWSLAVEEHFYLVWPAVVRKLRSSVLAKILLAIIVCEPLARAVSFVLGWEEGLSFYTWLVADGLAAGALLALYVRSRRFSRRGLAAISGGLISVAGLMVLMGAPHGVLTRLCVWGAALQLTAANSLFAGLLGITLLLGASRFSYVVTPRPLRFFGNISYGLYLMHWIPFCWYDAVLRAHWLGFHPMPGRLSAMLVRFLVAGAVGILLAALSRQYFEEAFLRLKERFAP